MPFIPFILTFSRGFCDLWAENNKCFIALNEVDATSLIGQQVGHLALIKPCCYRSINLRVGGFSFFIAFLWKELGFPELQILIFNWYIVLQSSTVLFLKFISAWGVLKFSYNFFHSFIFPICLTNVVYEEAFLGGSLFSSTVHIWLLLVTFQMYQYSIPWAIIQITSNWK